ncbi:alpha/beta fold hydrolase [Thalassotalea fusca]
MNRLIIILVGVLTSFTLLGKEVKQSWTSYAQGIDIKQYIGKKFEVSAAIRMKEASTASQASLWVRIDTKSGYNFFKNDAGTGKVTNNWQRFKIKGVIKDDSEILNFGALCINNGEYFYDDFVVKIEDKSGSLVPIHIKNGNFENPDHDGSWSEGIVARKFNTSTFDISYSQENPYEGKTSLKIQANSLPGSMEHGKFVQVNGVKLYYEEYGKGEPLLLIHGNGQSISAYLNQIEEYAKQFRVIALDSRGRGNSSYNDGDKLTYQLQVEDTKLFLDKIGVSKAHIVGWSDGGIIGLMMAIKYPEKVSSLISMAANIFPEGLTGLDSLVDFVENADIQNDGEYSFSTELIRMMTKYPQLTFSDLSAIQAKTLIIAGDRDEIKTKHTVNIAEAIPNAQLAILPNTGHYMPSANPELFNQTVMRFLSSVN